MQANIFDAFHLAPDDNVSLTELIRLSGFSEQDLYELIDCGALVPQSTSKPWVFKAECIVTIQKAKRLQDDFELQSSALALLITLLQQVDSLENELKTLQAKMPKNLL